MDPAAARYGFFWVVEVVDDVVDVVDVVVDDEVVVDCTVVVVVDVGRFPGPGGVVVVGASENVVDVDGGGGGGGGAVVGGVTIRRPRASGAAVNSDWAGTPSSATFIVPAKIEAGKDPPVTRLPCTFSIGSILSGWPTHTAVESWGT